MEKNLETFITFHVNFHVHAAPHVREYAIYDYIYVTLQLHTRVAMRLDDGAKIVLFLVISPCISSRILREHAALNRVSERERERETSQ